MKASKTLSNIDIIANSEINDNNSKKGEIGFLEYKKRFNTLEHDEKENNNNQKKMGGKKVNTNLKLLKIIKERMKEQ